ncbi:nitrite reductase large subunit [Phycicoccus sp. CSK15P-2]|uniref:nitrite reductase large subunit NirB n=1 Tax=Phycicoccus sp. CSK15P-2 TaxID=2807627 RepID=UPI0019513610|nr:nitrite reductase large subunit NirB [Phycicoccus sp. CSK15P-2]MBM6404980.1 nitrite reductase large subunit [Phycicoccus sp. CSK15P-2]
MTEHVVVVGGGMVAHRFVEALRARDTEGAYAVTVLAEEPRAPYDRVGLSAFFSGTAPEDLALGDPALWEDPLVALRLGDPATGLDRDARTVTTASGDAVGYDHLVLATGSYAWVPPLPGADLPGVFVYRTVEDVVALREWVQERAASLDRPVRGAVVGGGLLGLEAAGALTSLDVATTVVEFAPRLMALQVDEGGGQALRRIIEGLGVDVRTGAASEAVEPADDGTVGGLRLTGDDDPLPVDVVVVATGVRPRDELAAPAGLAVGPRGGVLVDEGCRTPDERVYAVGEVACIEGRCLGLVAPGYTMAEIAVDRLLGGDATFPGADLSTKLKLLGVDVASFGDAFATSPGALEIVHSDPVSGTYKKLVLSDDARVLLGGILVGDASSYASLRPMVGAELGDDPGLWLVPEGAGARPQTELPDAAQVCSCNGVSAGTIRASVVEDGCHDLPAVKACTRAGTSCGSCVPLVKKLMSVEMAKAGLTVSSAMCEHFAMARAELFNAVMVSGLRRWSEIVERFGTGRGCDICKPAVASILATLYNEHVLAEDRAALQDTNDRVMANMQKDGTYSVVPRVPGGEIRPEQLVLIGEVAQEFGLYTKITGGQRIDLFGARLEQLPAIWQRLVDGGLESGHAYGKALRTVKSCVGSSWCRYGVQDSVGMAVAMELRYRGLRSPHKLKLGVSGCARECAEARGKDVGLIATENGWNVYVGGNGGFTPRHAQLLVEDVDTESAVRIVDRYLMYYVRTADRLQRTAPWQEDHEGGLDRIREIVVDDALGIGADLDAQMARHVDSYEDEWAAVLRDPERLRQFSSFVNAPDTPDPTLAYVEERGQRRPATDEERAHGPVLIAPATLEVRS